MTTDRVPARKAAMTKDQVFSEPRSQIVDFAFDETVASVFPDMIRRSVPGYELVVPMTGLLAARALRDAASRRAYDLGCSLGAMSAIANGEAIASAAPAAVARRRDLRADVMEGLLVSLMSRGRG